MPNVVIVGAGISGLSIAFRLQQILPSAQIRVLEQNDRPGGTVWTERRDGFQLEWGPNGFLDNKPATLSLCRDLGLGDQLLAASDASGRNRYLCLDKKLVALPGSLGAFVKSDLLSWGAKLSFLAERFRRPRREGGDESIDAFARRRAGNEVAEVFADALVTGIHAGDPKMLSVQACFPRLVSMENSFGSVMRGFAQTAKQRKRDALARGEEVPRPGRMWSLRSGLRTLIEALTSRLEQIPLYGVGIRQVQHDPAKRRWHLRGSGADQWVADAIVLACPAFQQASILADMDADLAERVSSIAYNRVAVVGLGYRQADVDVKLDGFGYIVPQRLRRDILGVQWCSSIFPQRSPDGMVLLRAMCGGWHRPEVVSWDDARLLAAIRAEFKETLGITQPPVFHQIVRWDRAIPQYHLGHLERVAWIEQRAAHYPGLFLGGNAYHGVALNDCTERAEITAQGLKKYFENKSTT